MPGDSPSRSIPGPTAGSTTSKPTGPVQTSVKDRHRRSYSSPPREGQGPFSDFFEVPANRGRNKRRSLESSGSDEFFDTAEDVNANMTAGQMLQAKARVDIESGNALPLDHATSTASAQPPLPYYHRVAASNRSSPVDHASDNPSSEGPRHKPSLPPAESNPRLGRMHPPASTDAIPLSNPSPEEEKARKTQRFPYKHFDGKNGDSPTAALWNLFEIMKDLPGGRILSDREPKDASNVSTPSGVFGRLSLGPDGGFTQMTEIHKVDPFRGGYLVTLTHDLLELLSNVLPDDEAEKLDKFDVFVLFDFLRQLPYVPEHRIFGDLHNYINRRLWKREYHAAGFREPRTAGRHTQPQTQPIDKTIDTESAAARSIPEPPAPTSPAAARKERKAPEMRDEQPACRRRSTVVVRGFAVGVPSNPCAGQPDLPAETDGSAIASGESKKKWNPAFDSPFRSGDLSDSDDGDEGDR